jgi:hypothetical protein
MQSPITQAIIERISLILSISLKLGNSHVLQQTNSINYMVEKGGFEKRRVVTISPTSKGYRAPSIYNDGKIQITELQNHFGK